MARTLWLETHPLPTDQATELAEVVHSSVADLGA
jgi:hypothetical protein